MTWQFVVVLSNLTCKGNNAYAVMEAVMDKIMSSPRDDYHTCQGPTGHRISQAFSWLFGHGASPLL